MENLYDIDGPLWWIQSSMVIFKWLFSLRLIKGAKNEYVKAYIQSSLKGVSQVMLQENLYTGLLFFIAIFYVNQIASLYMLLATFVELLILPLKYLWMKIV